MFGDQFVSFVSKQLLDTVAPDRDQRVKKSLEKLQSSKQLIFPDYNSYPYHLRELFEYYKALIHRDDLLDFAKGTLFKENIVNVYFKMLEKVGFVLQGSYNFHRATTRNSSDLYSAATQTPG